MRHVKTHFSSEHLDGGLEQDHGDGAVHVVVTVKKNRLVRGDGVFETVDGSGHAEHQEWIVQMRGLGIEEGKSLDGLSNAAGDEQFGENQGETGFACKSG